MTAIDETIERVVPLHPFSEAQALDWLRVQPGGRITATDAELSRRWSWPRQRVGRRLKAWAKAGHIKRRGDAVTVVGAEGGTNPGTTTGTNCGTRTGTHRALEPVTSRKLTRPSRPPDLDKFAEQRASSVSEKRIAPDGIVTVMPQHRGSPVLAAVLAALALVIAAVGIAINGWFAGSLGKTTEAAALFVAIGITADALAFLLPTAASRLSRARRYAGAIIAWVLWAATMAFALLASAGFAGLNISDMTAARARDALGAQTLAVRIERLQIERTGITEKRSVAALEANLQAARPSAALVWKQTNGCRDVTIVASGQACAVVLQARQRLAEAQRRDVIDAELRDAEALIAHGPAISSADPQAATAAKMVNWVSAGLTNVSTTDIGNLRIVLMTLLPQCAGLVLMLAMGLWHPARKGH
jgi:hypothetical protein